MFLSLHGQQDAVSYLENLRHHKSKKDEKNRFCSPSNLLLSLESIIKDIFHSLKKKLP